MRNKPYNEVFSDKRKLETMLEFRRQGFSLISLGIIFGVDFSTIYYHCKKNHIQKLSEPKEFSIPALLSMYQIRAYRPKSYAEYLSDSKERSRLRSI